MKSLQVAQLHLSEEELARYTDLKVLKSAEGYYVGTEYHNPAGFTEPGSRDTVYYYYPHAAKVALAQLESGEYDMELYRFNP